MMQGGEKKKKAIYKPPEAVSLSGVAQGACTTGSQYVLGNCSVGGNAQRNCLSGTIADHVNCNTGGNRT